MTIPASSYCWDYDVFLSFRGEDTRKGFTGNLYHALHEKGINTFIDDQELRKGDEITSALVNAIQNSRIAIVIFSANYASSSFCLEELVEIMEFIEHKGRLVWPVFYGVDPSNVRHQRGSYGEALAKLEGIIDDKQKVKRWRFALQEAANLSGWHFQHGYEHELIRKIIQEVSKRINRVPLHVANHPVALESRVQKVNSLLDVESDDGVRMVGIYGTGGMGKTTLACSLYNCIADEFESLCFLADIRENSKHGLLQLQETLLSELLGEKDIKLGSVRVGIPIIQRRLCQKKILLILDDVDKSEQLDALAGGLDWFGSGSRIIITTRDKHLLQVCGVERTYEVEGLNHKEALELFSWSAFKRPEVDHNYMDISERVILHSSGLPLSLEIIGSDLFGKSLQEWKSALDTYERIPHENIQRILRVSYDGLKEFEKEIFLDMSCFFKGYELCDVMKILHICRGFAPNYVIQVLIDKCLLKIDQGRVRMHDLIEDMGREIVRQESPSKPGERSRLWFSKDILHVFKENKGTDKLEFIMLHLFKGKEVQWDGNALKNMENLKILVIENVRFSKGPSHLPKSLRVLKWCGYPESSLPNNFDPKKLVIMDLSMSFFSFNNQLVKNFKSLTEMKLSGCQVLTQVPNLCAATNLKKLHLDDCQNLVEVDDSIGFLEKLEELNLNYCSRLRVLPRGICLTSLKILSLRNCTSLKSFPEILGKMENTRYVDLCYSSIRELPSSIGNLVGLTMLTLKGCNGLLELPSSIFKLPKLDVDVEHCQRLALVKECRGQDQETMSSTVGDIGSFQFVKSARFGYCCLTDESLDAILPFLSCMTLLNLSNNNMTILPSSIKACRHLTALYLDECKDLREVRGLPTNIRTLSAQNCMSLTSHSKRMLLTQALQTQATYFCFPSAGLSVQGLFNHCTTEASVSFWLSNKFPVISVCAVDFVGHFSGFEFGLIINGGHLLHRSFSGMSCSLKTNHIMLLNKTPEYRCEVEKFIESGWNHAKISLSDSDDKYMVVEWMGFQVQAETTSVADIRFTNPEPEHEHEHELPTYIVQKNNERVRRRFKRSQKFVTNAAYV